MQVIFFGTLWVFHFLMSSLKSERSSYMLGIILKLLYTVISLQYLNLTYTAYLCSSHHESLKAQKAIIEV
ncbi:hypothetical protein ZIOFF_018572 [Zingiber officinale]|uniref:Uncharacterized protein n=1 Tax=Zingiber officinale TaxID=94328 RepID=A0A8J5HGK7_ZINOF|nr:hypothetical protein ZIOFF_018572 [Zingiber officinale]